MAIPQNDPSDRLRFTTPTPESLGAERLDYYRMVNTAPHIFILLLHPFTLSHQHQLKSSLSLFGTLSILKSRNECGLPIHITNLRRPS